MLQLFEARRIAAVARVSARAARCATIGARGVHSSQARANCCWPRSTPTSIASAGGEDLRRGPAARRWPDDVAIGIDEREHVLHDAELTALAEEIPNKNAAPA